MPEGKKLRKPAIEILSTFNLWVSEINVLFFECYPGKENGNGEIEPELKTFCKDGHEYCKEQEKCQ